MADQTVRYYFTAEFNAGDSVAAARTTGREITKVLAEIGEQRFEIGKVDIAEVRREAERAGVEFSTALRQTLVNTLTTRVGDMTRGLLDPNFARAVRDIGGMVGQQEIPHLREINGLLKARNELLAAEARLQATQARKDGRPEEEWDRRFTDVYGGSHLVSARPDLRTDIVQDQVNAALAKVQRYTTLLANAVASELEVAQTRRGLTEAQYEKAKIQHGKQYGLGPLWDEALGERSRVMADLRADIESRYHRGLTPAQIEAARAAQSVPLAQQWDAALASRSDVLSELRAEIEGRYHRGLTAEQIDRYRAAQPQATLGSLMDEGIASRQEIAAALRRDIEQRDRISTERSLRLQQVIAAEVAAEEEGRRAKLAQLRADIQERSRIAEERNKQARENRRMEEADERRLREAELQRLRTAIQRRYADEETRAADAVPATDITQVMSTADASRLGRALANVETRERQLAEASRQLAELRNREGRTATQVWQAEERVRVAADRLAVAQSRLADMTARRSLSEQFMMGFRGASERPYAEQIGQAFKFSVFYGTAYKLLFTFTQVMQQTLQEGIAFQQAMTELKIATGRAGSSVDEIADIAGANAAEAGFAPSQGILTAARSLGLFGATDAQGASLSEQRMVADISSRIISRMATGSEFQPEDLQANIAAIAQAFQTGAAGQVRVYDLDAYLARYFGIGAGSTLESVAQSATVGRGAGFNQEEITAIAANLQSRTGQTPSAVAGFMAQIFSRGGEGTLTKIADRYGIDTQQELAKQIAQLARVYETASSAEQLEIAAAFGRGKIQNAGVVLLEEWDIIMEAARKAREEAQGAGDDAFEQRLDNLGGQINLTAGAVADFASALSQSGVFDIFGAGLTAFRELLESATALVRVWNDLPGAIRATIAALATFRAAAALGAFDGAIGRGQTILGNAAIGAAAGRGGRAGLPLAHAANSRLLAGMVGGAATVIPSLAVAAGVYGLGQMVSSDRSVGSQLRANASLTGVRPESDTSEAYLAKAAALEAAIDDSNKQLDGIWGSFAGGADALRRQIDRMKDDAEYYKRVAEEIDNAEVQRPAEVLIESLDRESIEEAMNSIAASGGTAREQLDALVIALNGVGREAGTAAERLAPKPDVAARQIGADLYQLLTEAVDPLVKEWSESRFDGLPLVPNIPFTQLGMNVGEFRQSAGLADRVNVGADKWREFMSPEQFEATLRELMEQYGGLMQLAEAINDGRAYEDIRRIEAAFLESVGQNPDVSTRIIPLITEAITKRAESIERALTDEGPLSAEQTQAVFGFINDKARGLLQLIPEVDHAGRSEAIGSLLTEMEAALDRTTDPTPQLLADMQTMRDMFFEVEFARLDNMRKVAQQNARSEEEVTAQGNRFLQEAIQAAIESRNAQNLVRVLETAGLGAIAIAEGMINDAIRTINMAQAMQRRMAQMAAAVMPMMRAVLGPASVLLGMTGQAELDSLNAMQSALGNVVSAGAQNVWDTGKDVPTVKDRFGGSSGAAKKGMSPEERARRMREYRYNLALLRIDQTDPLAMAQLDLRFARQDLARARARGNRFDIAEQRVAVQNAQTNVESEKFRQRLSDVQTAERLGRISHTEYIKYLENESKRLNRIKDRTRQQQDQLNEIDMLLKEATESAHDQWNFGDIRLPKPYQVRRYIEAQANGVSMDARRDNLITQRNVTINVNGADTAKVREIIHQEVGRNSRTTTPLPRRR